MKDKKAIRIFQKLSFEQVEQLDKFVRSAYFNNSPPTMALFDYLVGFYPTFEASNFSSETAYNYVYPDKDWNEKRLINLFSKFQKLLEEFIVMQQARADFQAAKMETYKPLLHFYRKKGLPDLQKSELNRLQSLLAKRQHSNYVFLYDRYIYEQELAQYMNSYDARKGDINLQSMSDQFDRFYLARKLILFCNKIGRQSYLKIDYKIPLLQETLDYIEKGNFENIIAISVWKRALYLLMYPEEIEHYQLLKDALLKHHQLFPQIELLPLFSYLVNTAKSIFLPKQAYYHELHELYKFQVKHELHIYNNYVIPSVFKNAITASLRHGELGWAEKFMEENQTFLSPGLREDVYRFNKAEVAFYKKEYERVLELHQQMEYQDLFYLIGSKRTLAKTYYELKEMDLLDSHLNAFRVFIFRQKDKISESNLKSNQNFINFLNKIIGILPKESKKIKHNIKRIKSTTEIWEQLWLVEKLEEKH